MAEKAQVTKRRSSKSESGKQPPRSFVAPPLKMRPRFTARHSVRNTLAQESLFGVALAQLVELELFTLDEVKSYMQKYEHYRAMTNRRLEDSAVSADVLEHWIEWLCLLMRAFTECCQRLKRWEAEMESEIAKGGAMASQAQLREARGLIKKSMTRNLRSFLRKFPLDRRADLTALDLQLRLGETAEFDRTISRLIMSYPREPVYWYLAVRRRVASGDYAGALALCQRALRYHPDDAELGKSLRRLTLLVATVGLAAPPPETEDDSVSTQDYA